MALKARLQRGMITAACVLGVTGVALPDVGRQMRESGGADG